MKKYLTIRADIKQSRLNKKYLELNEIVLQINKDINDYLIPMSIRAGDEIFAIYTSLFRGLEAYQLLITLAKDYEIPLYIGIGYGTLDSEVEDQNLINGKSIWRATKALEDISKSATKYNEKVGNHLDLKVIVSDSKEINKYHQTLFFLLTEKILKRTSLQSRAVYLLKNNPNIEYNVLYDKLEKSLVDKSSIDDKKNKFLKYLQRAEYFIVNDMVDLLINEVK